ncbi:type III secretion protein Q [Duganella sp. CF458]|uniref:type III secretion system cytoplasmic ring protein SctQ n=1 Tax=Duganella sp. CF458 TaxID=1884368 RepID=UPI0008F37659|nr:type III secretion system cytoplasmic ring protein SctQ [Duganella sp. CF458]SFF95577.1 type III secretion protein Q [Duganella sp. CF458]
MAETEWLPAAHAKAMRLQKDAIGAAGAALSRRVACGLWCSHAGMSLHLESAVHGADPHQESGIPGIALEGPHGTFYLEHGAALLHGLTGVDPMAAADAPAAQREWLDGALLGRLAGTPLAGMRTLRRDTAPPVAAGLAAMHLRLDDGAHMAGALIRATPESWLALLERHEWQPRTQALEALHALRIALPVKLGSHFLPSSALQELVAGDIILPDSTRFDTQGLGRLPLGGMLAQVRYAAPGLLTILTMETQLNYDSEDEAGGVDDAALDQLPLALSFELGTLQLSLGQLRTLASGAVLQLSQGSADSIAIVCAGRHLGRGEAVDVDGRLGVRITSWSAA